MKPQSLVPNSVIPVRYLLYALPLFLFSCVTLKDYNMEVLRPAKVSIPPQVKSVVIVDNVSDHFDSIPVTVTTNLTTVQKISLKADSISGTILTELKEELYNRQFFDTIFYDAKILKSASFKGRPGPYSISELENIKKKYQCDAVILLNKLAVSPSVTAFMTGFGETYAIEQEIKGALWWQVVDLNIGTVMDSYIQKDSLVRSDYTDRLKYPVKTSIKELAKRMGYYYADRIAPYWEPVERYYYSMGNNYSSIAEGYLKQKKLEEAEKVWFYIYNNGKPHQKAAAAHNIALAKEIQGKFEEATDWAHICYDLLERKSGIFDEEREREKYYYHELAKRYLDESKLTEQLGGE